MKDLCCLIAINTRRMGEAAGERGDLYTLDLTIKFFNTYLRAVINASDVRTAYNILHQYRKLAEFTVTIRDGEEPMPDPSLASGDPLSSRGLNIAKHMRYYGGVAFQRGLTFITEVVAHDIGALCEKAFRSSSDCHDKLLATFLKVDDSVESGKDETALRGVRRAQIKLAVAYLVLGSRASALDIQRDMAEEPHSRLISLRWELESLQGSEFWEVNDRGGKFDYLGPREKEQLPLFFSWFPNLGRDDSQIASVN